ncbi:MAG: RimK family alpha-L-glutamate ligase [Desulfatiglandaceae bacterium]
MMVMGILSVRDKRYHPNQRLMEAATRLGQSMVLIHTRDCLSQVRDGELKLSIPHSEVPDILLPRIGASINDYALSVVRQFEECGITVVNGSDAIRLARNKFMSLQSLAHNGIPVPDSFLVVNFKGFERAASALGGYPVVVKMPSSRQGAGVTLVDSRATAEFVIHNLQDTSRGLLIQEYVPPSGRQDIRAFVLGDRIVGAMGLRPENGDFRSNIHLTGNGKPLNLDKRLRQLAVKATHTLGLEIAGVDLMVDKAGNEKVIEVNYSPGFRGLEKATGKDIATHIIQYVTHDAGGQKWT